ncbi:MAG: hypothetical protein QM647_09995 [Asticcacaulis sp.]|uniref:DUF7940 domain-containing protein n=1 Tax=Asticcacaulis sp. TaxID=1872648 RepID=UPI0039E6174A
MKLIDNWRSALRAYSTWALGAVAAIPALWLQVPDEVKALIPAQDMAKITAVIAVAGLVGRFVDQGTGTTQS